MTIYNHSAQPEYQSIRYRLRGRGMFTYTHNGEYRVCSQAVRDFHSGGAVLLAELRNLDELKGFLVAVQEFKIRMAKP